MILLLFFTQLYLFHKDFFILKYKNNSSYNLFFIYFLCDVDKVLHKDDF